MGLVAMPLLAVVSGPAGSGTTELADALAAAIPCPVVRRDEIKEGLVHAVGGFDSFEPIDLPVPSVEVDTTNGYEPSLEEIVAFVNR